MVKQQPFYANKNGVKCSRTSSRLEIRQLNYTDIEKDGEPFQIYTTTGIFLLHMSGGGKKNWQISWSTFSPFHVILSTFRVCLSKKPKKSPPRVPRLCFSPKILFFLWIKTPSKFSESWDDRFREKSKYLSMVPKVSWDRNLKTNSFLWGELYTETSYGLQERNKIISRDGNAERR